MVASPQPTAPTSNGTKFKLFTRSHGRSPAPHKREPPPELSLEPPRTQGRWEAESDGEFRSHETLDLSTPLSSVRTAPATLVHAPSPLYPQPQTASHTAQFLTPSPSPSLHSRQQLQHPFSANYEGRSQESDRDDASRSLRRVRDKNRRHAIHGPSIHAREQHNGRIPSPFRGRSPDSRETGGEPSPATWTPGARGSPQALIEGTVTGEDVDLDVYPWFIFLHGEPEVRIEPKRIMDQEGQGFSFISLC